MAEPEPEPEPQPRVRSPLPPPPVLNERPSSSAPPRPDEEDDPVEMFNAANVAADMAKFQREQELEAERQRRREKWMKAKWPIMGGVLLAVVLLTAVVTMWLR